MILRVLEQDNPGLVARVGELDRGQRRLLASAAARLALLISPVDDPRIQSAWEQIGLEAVDPEVTARLQALVDELDDKAAALQLELDATRELGNEPRREADLVAMYGRTFDQARAAEALVSALDADLDEAVGGALYEANAALDYSPAAIRALVEAVHDGVPDPAGRVAQQLRGG